LNTIRVEFINGRDQSILGVSDMPLAQLPDSFRIRTTLNIAERKWSVSSATPVDKVDFAETGQLCIVLSEIEHAAPKDILFSLPTISDDCGQATGGVLPHEGLFQIHEDSWRQIEFVAQSFHEAIRKELSEIITIYNTERLGVAFKRIHVRNRIREPLSGISLRLEELVRLLPQQKSYEAVSFQQAPGTIPGSFAWQTVHGPVVWGITDDKGNVALLCLEHDSVHTQELSDALSRLSEEKGLILVDWCRAAAISGSSEAFREYLDQRS
jgi:hypothetical protein